MENKLETLYKYKYLQTSKYEENINNLKFTYKLPRQREKEMKNMNMKKYRKIQAY